jgi:3-deoxy-D-manno-octulosonic-acid transferase
LIWRSAYSAVLWLALPLVLVKLWWRGRSEQGYRVAIGERFGLYRGFHPPAANAPARPLVWIHAVSLGETRALQPLFSRLQERLPGHDFLVTAMTATGREAASQLFGASAQVAWLPYDYGFSVRRFLARFRPRVGILMETEVWFNLVRECGRAHVPLLLANARLSEKSARGYEVVSPLARTAFAALDAVAAQTQSDARRLLALGARRVEVTGNLKFDVKPRVELDALAQQFRLGYGNRKVLLAASTREGEEELILDALEQAAHFPELVVIVPRHPQRFAEVERLLAKRGHRYALRSARMEIRPDCAFVVGDSVGEMHAYYAASDVAFVGGSLLALGGQNLIEACAAGVPVLFGPYMYNFEEAAKAALEAGAARLVVDAFSLVREATSLLGDDESRKRMGNAGLRFCAEHRGATQKIASLAEELLRIGAG